MPLTTEEITARRTEITALQNAIAQHETSVRAASGAQIQYRSIDEMIRAVDYLQSQLDDATGDSVRPFRVSYIAHGGRGFD